MIYSDPFFRKRSLNGLLLGTALYAASITEGALLVKTPHSFTQVGVGAHSVAVSIFLMMGYCEVTESVKKVYKSVKANYTHLIALSFLFAATAIHVVALIHIHQKGAPLSRNDPTLIRYLDFCKVYILSNLLMEYFLFRLHSEKSVKTNVIRYVE
ncbi:MAG: hypothetical protein ACK4HV_06030 [Parachlamydiaceae bacterium]